MVRGDALDPLSEKVVLGHLGVGYAALGSVPLRSPCPSPSPSSLPCGAMPARTNMKLEGPVGGQAPDFGPELPCCPLMGQNMLGWKWGTQRDKGQGEEPGGRVRTRASPGEFLPG